jgi:hypothetical protein
LQDRQNGRRCRRYVGKRCVNHGAAPVLSRLSLYRSFFAGGARSSSAEDPYPLRAGHFGF